MLHPVLLSAIPEESAPIVAQMMTLVEGPRWKRTGVAGDLAPGEIGPDGLMTRRKSSVVIKHFVSSDDAPKGGCWVCKTQCINLLEHLFFFG
jgi:hypothetical protein